MKEQGNNSMILSQRVVIGGSTGCHRPLVGHLSASHRPLVGHLSATYRPLICHPRHSHTRTTPNHTQTTPRHTHTISHSSATYRPLIGHSSATHRPPIGHLSATRRPPICHPMATRRPPHPEHSTPELNILKLHGNHNCQYCSKPNNNVNKVARSLDSECTYRCGSMHKCLWFYHMAIYIVMTCLDSMKLARCSKGILA